MKLIHILSKKTLRKYFKYFLFLSIYFYIMENFYVKFLSPFDFFPLNTVSEYFKNIYYIYWPKL